MEATSELAWLRAFCGSGQARAVRERAQVSLSEIGREIEATPTTVWRWETGARRPTGDAALRYAAVLRRLRQVTKRMGVA